MSAQAPPSSLVESVLAFADDELVLGWRDSEWTGVAPFLEEDVAFSSIAQGEIGHARALYELVAGVLGGDADALAFDREPGDYRCAPFVELQLVGDWAATIARHWLYEAADAIRVQALMELRLARARRARREDGPRGGTTTACTHDVGRRKLRGERPLRGGVAELWPYALGVLDPGQRERLASSSAATRSRRSSAARTTTASPPCTRR